MDTIVEIGFDFTDAQNLLPSGRVLSAADRLQVIRGFERERPEFARRVDLAVAAEFDVRAEVREIDGAMERVILVLLEGRSSRAKLAALGAGKVNAMNDPACPDFAGRDQHFADLESSDHSRVARAIMRLHIHSEEFSQLIREELAELTGAQCELRQSQFRQSLESRSSSVAGTKRSIPFT